MNCMSCLPSHFLITDTLSALFILYVLSMLFTSNLKFLSSICLPIASQSNMQCFNEDTPI